MRGCKIILTADDGDGAEKEDKYRPPGGGGGWGHWSVGTSPYGRGTYGYAHSPLRGVCPPGTKSDGHKDGWARKTDGEKVAGYEMGPRT
ncbi:MAG: hypothetical protein EOM59_19445 [Clostridia bacterium]|nr:hypothetical protein [Clostridia bacterium]